LASDCNRKRIVVVLGMHRSGTSVTMNLLNTFGVALSDDLMEPTEHNARGYFESREIFRLHDEIFATIGMTWRTSSLVIPLAKNWWRAAPVQSLKAELSNIVQRELERHDGPWGFKDPRTSRLLPLWLELVEELGLDPRFVLATRNPNDVAKSLFLRDQIDPIDAEILWLEHNADAVLSLRSRIDAIVDYSRWMSDPVEQARYMLERLHLDWQGTPEEISRITDEVISPHLRHHDTASSSFKLPFTAPFHEALLNRDLSKLCSLAEAFNAARGFAKAVLAPSRRTLQTEIIDQLSAIIRVRGERIIDLEAQLANRDRLALG
jgi:hypothetical protein